MSYIKKFIHSLAAKEVRVLGRWKLETCVNKTNSKIDYANEDHCGVCSDNKPTNNIVVIIPITPTSEDENDDYLRYMM
jgi:hypothetical protein